MGRKKFLNKYDVKAILNKGDVQHLPSSDLIKIALYRATKVKGRNETTLHNKRETTVGF